MYKTYLIFFALLFTGSLFALDGGFLSFILCLSAVSISVYKLFEYLCNKYGMHKLIAVALMMLVQFGVALALNAVGFRLA